MPIREAMEHFNQPPSAAAQSSPCPAASLSHAKLYMLPNTIQSLAGLIGLPKTLLLVQNFGGLAMRIPHGATKAGKAYLQSLAHVVGEEAAALLSQVYGASQLYIPNCKDALVKARDRQLLADRDQLAKAEHSERDIVAILARKYSISDRYVWKIFKKPVPQENVSRGQGSLLG